MGIKIHAACINPGNATHVAYTQNNTTHTWECQRHGTTTQYKYAMGREGKGKGVAGRKEGRLCVLHAGSRQQNP